ncbi:unnamed protein product [Rotaria sp. Silwood1]|nr:unnamed protein product [Rotaria sp. Silwood1]CAF1625266.1 unnamed protein product [Rotaria sp. Silwood1]CAF4637370.1 unnamed protein product [Rotaria sp. Silwood1]
MAEKCSIATCARASYALCHGCQLNFCREHMIEHTTLTQLQINPLIVEVNKMNDEIHELNPKNLYDVFYQKLDKWRIKSHQMIDMYFEKKIKELDLYLNEQVKKLKNTFNETYAKIESFIQEKEITHEQINLLTFEIQGLRKDINKINNDFQIQTKPLTLEKNLINFDQTFHVSNLPPIYRIIDRNDRSFTPLATDNKFLLLHHEGNLLLVDEELTTPKQVPWKHGPIYDMCYSLALKRFIIINENEVFLLNQGNMTIDKVRSIQWQQWFSCTCSDTSLYLSTKVYHSSLLQFNLLPSIVFFKRWSSPDLCTNDEAIDGIIYKDNKLALMISNDAKRVLRIELRSSTTFDRIWSLPLDIIYNEKQAYRFCSINHNEWLVADHSDSRLLHITKDGVMKSEVSYTPAPCCLIEFGHNMLAISTKTVVHLHKL